MFGVHLEVCRGTGRGADLQNGRDLRRHRGLSTHISTYYMYLCSNTVQYLMNCHSIEGRYLSTIAPLLNSSVTM